MWTLPKPDVADAAAELETALTYASGKPVYALTGTERDAVASVYSAYDSLEGQPGPGLVHPDLAQACLDAVAKGYGEVQKNGRLERLRGRLLVQAEYCPSCGSDSATQLDHFLPKIAYPALAIHARNLVPSCGPCNNAKRAHDPAGGDRLVHAYFARIPSTTFLVATATMNADALSVTFSIDRTGLDANLAGALAFQLTRLGLDDRLKPAINRFLFEQRAGLEQILGTGDGALLRDFLRRSAKGQSTTFGANDWRPALLSGLAACDDFVNGGAARFFGRRRHVGA